MARLSITAEDVRLLAALAKDHPGAPAVLALYRRAYEALSMDEALRVTPVGQFAGVDDPLLFDLSAKHLALIHGCDVRTIRRWRKKRRQRSDDDE